MAAPTGGGGKFTIIKKKFDPTKTTLKEVVEMYIAESEKVLTLNLIEVNLLLKVVRLKIFLINL